ncbi:transposase [Burkholderia sp. LS-044]|nr:transposase [Burkholderia cenocepacia]RQS33779.1 transposase [Burkholderia sp. Bp8992]THJ48322.1 transposase [Burkholderia sp. LS-044]AQQ26699.1 hypothetical protein A8E88_14065 [Burkholderia cenocepacia]ONV95402.1 hypothetical protein A8E89_09080 [Burkholderia cenocepacia]
MRKRFTDEQIIGFLREAEAGEAVQYLCRTYGFSDTSFYSWRAKFGGNDGVESQRLKYLEGENNRLRKLLAEALAKQGASGIARDDV